MELWGEKGGRGVGRGGGRRWVAMLRTCRVQAVGNQALRWNRGVRRGEGRGRGSTCRVQTFGNQALRWNRGVRREGWGGTCRVQAVGNQALRWNRGVRRGKGRGGRGGAMLRTCSPAGSFGFIIWFNYAGVGWKWDG